MKSCLQKLATLLFLSALLALRSRAQYVGGVLRGDALAAALSVISLNASNVANATPLPSQSGSASGGVSYSFTHFSMNLNLGSDVSLAGGSATMPRGTPNAFNVTWHDTAFSFTFNYHICKHLARAAPQRASPLMHICEDGEIKVFTISNLSAPISVSGVANFAAEKVFVNVTRVQLHNPHNIEVYVHVINK